MAGYWPSSFFFFSVSYGPRRSCLLSKPIRTQDSLHLVHWRYNLYDKISIKPDIGSLFVATEIQKVFGNSRLFNSKRSS